MKNEGALWGTVEEIHQKFLGGELTCEELVSEYIRRIDSYDKKGPGINAILSVNPDALQVARRLDDRLRTEGLAGQLHGIPVLVKDNVDTIDMPTTGGSVCLANNIPPRDAFIVSRLKQAGAVILAKANLHEFAIWGETTSSIGGQTRNPFNTQLTPGGSSGGTGAGLAAGFAAVGIGTDTVNSVRSPASANGLVGIRPTMGLVSRSGIIPYSLTHDTAGPITRSVQDAALLLDIISGYDPQDHKTAWAWSKRAADCLQTRDTLKGKRIGILRSLFGREPRHAEVNAAIENNLALLRSNGAELIEICECIEADYIASKVSVHLYELRDDLNTYLRLLDPASPVHSLEEIVASGKYCPGIRDNLLKAVSLSKESGEYSNRLVSQMHLRDQVMQVMALNNLDAMVYPHQKRLVVPIGEPQTERNGALAAAIGFPAITIPAGFSPPSKDAPLGVPIGIEFMGRPWAEQVLISIAYSLEQLRPFPKNYADRLFQECIAPRK